MLKTLAAKHGSTVTKMARKYKAKIDTRYGPRTCFEATVERAGRTTGRQVRRHPPANGRTRRSSPTASQPRPPAARS